MGVGFAQGAAGEDGHVAPGGVVCAYALHDVAFFRARGFVQYAVDGGAGGDVVGFWHWEAEGAGLSYEGVLFVEGLGGVDVELDARAVGAAEEHFGRLAIFHC